MQAECFRKARPSYRRPHNRGEGIADDQTIEERELIKKWVAKAKEANKKESEISRHVYKIRGSPKHGEIHQAQSINQ